MPIVQNPIVPGWYADPEARYYNGTYWIYVTRSFSDYKDQRNQDAFRSQDLVHWQKHEGILAMQDFPWVHKAVWAPTIVEKNGKYYYIFASNDIQSDAEYGGLEIAVADTPAGPFHGYLGRPLLDRYVNGAQPIDAHFFKDDDGSIYLYYGGQGHCNVCRMNETMDGFLPFADGAHFHEVTPAGYEEGPCMLKRDGWYYLMWSSGGFGNGSYHASYSRSKSPLGPFENPRPLLANQPGVAEGAGHHSYLQLPESGEWLVVYHRRYLGDPVSGNRVLCIDRMYFTSDGEIEQVILTNKWELK